VPGKSPGLRISQPCFDLLVTGIRVLAPHSLAVQPDPGFCHVQCKPEALSFW
jgi:hypothetical protein